MLTDGVFEWTSLPAFGRMHAVCDLLALRVYPPVLIQNFDMRISCVSSVHG